MCLTAPSHYLNQCWLNTCGVLWHSPITKDSFKGNAQDILDLSLRITHFSLQLYLPGDYELRVRTRKQILIRNHHPAGLIVAQSRVASHKLVSNASGNWSVPNIGNEILPDPRRAQWQPRVIAVTKIWIGNTIYAVLELSHSVTFRTYLVHICHRTIITGLYHGLASSLGQSIIYTSAGLSRPQWLVCDRNFDNWGFNS